MENLTILNNAEVCLRNVQSQKYVGAVTNGTNAQFFCVYPPASIQITPHSKQNLSNSAFRFKIVIFKEVEDREKDQLSPIFQGTRVFLKNIVTDEFFSCNSKGLLTFQRKSSTNEQMNKMMYKYAAWILIPHTSQKSMQPSSKSKITVYDSLCLKSSTQSLFLSCSTDGRLIAVGDGMQASCAWNIVKADIPYVPSWVYQKSPFNKFMNCQDVTTRSVFLSYPREQKSLKSHPPQLQQAIILQDLLDVMMGFDGNYIKKRPGTFTYIIQPHLQYPSCSVSLAELAYKILALPTAAFAIQSYIATASIDRGTICQAICQGLTHLLTQYKTMIVQLDQIVQQREMTLQGLWYQIQRSLRVMQSLNQLITQASSLKGGQLITLIMDLLNSNTDQQIVLIYSELFKSAMKPYVRMISKWIYEGVVEDRFCEFIIESGDSPTEEWGSWEDKFSLRTAQVPKILQKEAQMIFVTGKYLNILKACKKTQKPPFAHQIERDLDLYIKVQNFAAPIKTAYEWANAQLLRLVFEQYNFTSVLTSLKGYFFLEYGDLFLHFMNAAQEQLATVKISRSKQPKSRLVSGQKLQNLFQLLVRTSSTVNNSLKDDISAKIDSASLYQQMNRIKNLQPYVFGMNYKQNSFVKKDSRYVDFINLDFKSSFPLNIFLNKKAIAKYQALFRLIFWAKFTQQQLNATWLTLQATKQLPLPCYRNAYIINQRMLSFVKNFVHYLCYQVIDQNFLTLTDSLKRVRNFQQVIECHNAFLNTCLKDSGLVNSQLLSIITIDMSSSCQDYSRVKDYIWGVYKQKQTIMQLNGGGGGDKKIVGQSSLTRRKQNLRHVREMIEHNLQREKMQEFVGRQTLDFNKGMGRFLKQLYSLSNQNSKSNLFRLVMQLDPNREYIEKRNIYM